jgi:DNA-binding beta-propeller fold protein YncE
MNFGFRFEINTDAKSIQVIAPPSRLERFERIGFSSSGMMGVATSETNAVFLFRRKPDGLFEDAPHCRIGGPNSGLNYPHDVSFSACGDMELLAVAQRGGAIAIYGKNRKNGDYGSEPVFEISGPRTRLAFSDGVAFVPPNDDYLAACNLEFGTVTFYRRISLSPVRFETAPDFELTHPSICNPDGLAFSRCGKWLAIANHGNHSISIFRRHNGIFSGGKIKYGPEPNTVIQDPHLRHPHSVAFTPRTRRLIVTNAGANYFSAYEPISHCLRMEWSQSPTLQMITNEEEVFRKINAQNKMEGGPKGVAIHKNNLAFCSPEFGVKVFTFRER